MKNQNNTQTATNGIVDDAQTNSIVTTTNGMVSNRTAGKECVDLFFKIGAARAWTEDNIIKQFSKAFGEDSLVATKIAFYNRDVLQGQGERKIFRTILKFLAEKHPDIVKKNIHNIPEFGRWDDLITLFGTTLEKDVLDLIKTALITGENSLCGKWMPRENSKTYPGAYNKIRKHLGFSPKEYRQLLKKLTALANTVEQKMCAKEWNSIEYPKVASIAMKNYRKAFHKRDEAGFLKYIESLEKGETKVNAKAIFPHDIVKQYFQNRVSETDGRLLEQQWKSLPNFMEGSKNQRIMPVCDVSGSMSGLPMEVCVALGLYISERNEGIFKDCFITFSEAPAIEVIEGTTLGERIRNLSNADWGGSTNLMSTFEMILEQAKKHNVSENQMPNMILIMSDMQFNGAVKEPSDSAYKAIEREYKDAGYQMPKIVFWNLDAHDDVPVTFDQKGTALISGFSPSILTSLLSGANFTPEGIMFETINKLRYSVINV